MSTFPHASRLITPRQYATSTPKSHTRQKIGLPMSPPDTRKNTPEKTEDRKSRGKENVNSVQLCSEAHTPQTTPKQQSYENSAQKSQDSKKEREIKEEQMRRKLQQMSIQSPETNDSRSPEALSHKLAEKDIQYRTLKDEYRKLYQAFEERKTQLLQAYQDKIAQQEKKYHALFQSYRQLQEKKADHIDRSSARVNDEDQTTLQTNCRMLQRQVEQIQNDYNKLKKAYVTLVAKSKKMETSGTTEYVLELEKCLQRYKKWEEEVKHKRTPIRTMQNTQNEKYKVARPYYRLLNVLPPGFAGETTLGRPFELAPQDMIFSVSRLGQILHCRFLDNVLDDSYGFLSIPTSTVEDHDADDIVQELKDLYCSHIGLPIKRSEDASEVQVFHHHSALRERTTDNGIHGQGSSIFIQGENEENANRGAMIDVNRS